MRVDRGLLRIDAIVAVGTKVADRGSVVRTLQLSDGFIPLGARHVAVDVDIVVVGVLDRCAALAGEGRCRERARQKAEKSDDEHPDALVMTARSRMVMTRPKIGHSEIGVRLPNVISQLPNRTE